MQHKFALMRVFGIVPVWAASVLLCFHTLESIAQQDTLLLREYEVFATALQKSAAGIDVWTYNPERTPSIALQSADALLALQSNIPMRGYGPGSSFGISVRGGSAAHTQVLLNGIPFENPSLAQADLSLLPLFLFSDVSLLRGASGALLGNASVAGTLMLDNKVMSDAPRALAAISVGSWDDYSSGVKANYGMRSLSGNTALYIRTSENNFERSLADGSTQPQPHASYSTKGLLQGFSFSGRKGYNADASLWVSDTERQIPPTLSQADATATQYDKNLRVQGSVSKDFGGALFRTDAAYDQGILNYTDPEANIDDKSSYAAVHVSGTISTNWNNTALSAAIIFRESKALTYNYEGEASRSSPAGVISAERKFFKRKTSLSASLRGEWMNGEILPFIPSFGISQNVGKLVEIRATASRVYRLPGLNDLYWNPGGNPDLLPESGWAEEVGITYSTARDNLKLGITCFNRKIDNWIVWTAGAGYWSPHNLRSVWSRGIEGKAEARTLVANLVLNHRVEYTFTRATHTYSNNPIDAGLNKQLIYVPAHSFMVEERLDWKKFTAAATFQIQSERYTNIDNTSSLDPLALLHVQAGWTHAWQAIRVTLSLASRNVLNEEYQWVLNRPMPGRQYTTTLLVQYYKPRKTIK